MWRRELARAASVLVLALAGRAVAQESVSSASLRPTGPVTIRADKAEWEKGAAMVYTGNVRLQSGDLNLSGDRLELRQFAKGEFEARISGAPSKLDHTGLRDEQGQTGPPVHAEARMLTYDSRSDIVEVAGAAILNRGGDLMRGENIRYDVAHRRIQAEGGAGGQVEFTIQPPPRESGSAEPDKGETVPPKSAAPAKPGGTP